MDRVSVRKTRPFPVSAMSETKNGTAPSPQELPQDSPFKGSVLGALEVST